MSKIWVTGIGLVSALGPNRETCWQRAKAGVSPFKAITYFDASEERSGIAAEADWQVPKNPRGFSRSDLMSLDAAQEAVLHAGLEQAQIAQAGLFLGAGTGGLHLSEQIFAAFQKDPGSLNIKDFLSHNGDASVQLLAEKFKTTGPIRSVMTACSSSVLAMGEAFDQIQLGNIPLAIVGGADSITRLTHAGFNSLSAVDSQPCRPFDPDRKGMNLGECAAYMILEQQEFAQARGAKKLAELAGYGLSCDAHHMTAPPPDGNGAVRAMKAALKSAGLKAEQIDAINAHATATPANDVAETAALSTVFLPRTRKLYVSGTKSMTGHCLGAAGAIEAVLSVMALGDQIIPPTVNSKSFILEDPLTAVPTATSADLNYIMSNSFAFGGNNGSLIFARA